MDAGRAGAVDGAWSTDRLRAELAKCRNFFAIYFTLTGLHMLHVAGGCVMLLVFWRMASRNARRANSSLGGVAASSFSALKGPGGCGSLSARAQCEAQNSSAYSLSARKRRSGYVAISRCTTSRPTPRRR